MTVQTNAGTVSRIFVQERAGNPLTYVGCVGIRGIVVDPRQLEFTRCVDETGVVVDAIPRYPNPSPFDVTFAGNFKKWQGLFTKMGTGCVMNMFLANATCEDASKIADPNYFEDGLWLYDVKASSGYQLFNDTAITLDPNSAVRREDQISFVSLHAAFVGAMSYSIRGTAADSEPIRSLAVLDSGSCSDVICRPCDATGCLTILANNGTEFIYTEDGGETWSNITGSGAGTAQVFGTNAFLVGASSIKMSSDVTLALASWTSAVTDVAFAGLCNIAQIDARTLVVGGENGQVWRSTNGGGNWTQIRATTGTADFVKMEYNSVTGMIVAVQSDGTDTYFVYSSDRGKNWTTLGGAATGETYGVNSAPWVYASGQNTFIVVNGKLFKVSCISGAVSYAHVVVVNADTKITGIGGMDIKNPNRMFLTVGEASADGEIFVTNDGFDSSKQEVLPFSITTDQTTRNPIAVCHSKYGDSLLFAFGATVYEGKDWESFFTE